MSVSTVTRRTVGAAILALACVAAPAGATAAATPPEPVWEATGLHMPESVVYDAARDRYYVSNMASWGEDAVPGDGFISVLDGHGRVAQLHWATGLHNPKGLALANGRLYVGDDDALVEIDVGSGTVLARHAPADGPGQFNDCTADPDGNVYVFSSRLDTVFRLSGGKFEPWAPLDVARTGRPNGLRAEADRLLLGSWSVPAPEGEQEGHISTLAYADQAIGRIGDAPLGHIDGIEPDGHGGYTVTDWTRGHVFHLTADGQPTLLFTLPKGAADHHYRIDRKLLVVPQLLDNVVRAYHWEPSAP